MFTCLHKNNYFGNFFTTKRNKKGKVMTDTVLSKGQCVHCNGTHKQSKSSNANDKYAYAHSNAYAHTAAHVAQGVVFASKRL